MLRPLIETPNLRSCCGRPRLRAFCLQCGAPRHRLRAETLPVVVSFGLRAESTVRVLFLPSGMTFLIRAGAPVLTHRCICGLGLTAPLTAGPSIGWTIGWNSRCPSDRDTRTPMSKALFMHLLPSPPSGNLHRTRISCPLSTPLLRGYRNIGIVSTELAPPHKSRRYLGARHVGCPAMVAGIAIRHYNASPGPTSQVSLSASGTGRALWCIPFARSMF